MNQRLVKAGVALSTAALLMTTGCATSSGNKNAAGQGGTAQQQSAAQQHGTAMHQQSQQHAGQAQGHAGGAQGQAAGQVEIADQAAKNITQLNSVKQANVLVTNRNAYVAAVTHDGQGQLTRDMENQIAQQVRAAKPDVQNVYVTTNPDFVSRVNSYVSDVRQGRPVSGFVGQLNEMIQRVFPEAR